MYKQEDQYCIICLIYERARVIREKQLEKLPLLRIFIKVYYIFAIDFITGLL